MQKIKVFVSKEISIPVTADDWQLYTCSMNCTVAARALTSALKKAIKHISAGNLVDDAMDLFMYPVMNKYAKFGACDTEPRYVAYNALRKVIDK